MSQTDTGSAPAPKRRGRAAVSIALIVLASILLPFAAVTVWVRNLVLDTDRYVETVAPLARNEAVRTAVANRVATEVAGALDLEQRARDALPKRAQFLAGPIATGGDRLVHTVADRLLHTEAFPKIWDAANRNAHDQIVEALTGRRRGTVTNADGKVVINLRPFAELVVTKLATVAPGFAKNVDLSRIDTRFVLVDSSDLKSIQSYARLLDRLSWAVPILALVLYGLAIVVAPRRRTGLVRVGLGITIAMALTLVGYAFGRTLYIDNLPATVHSTAAAAAVFDQITRFFERTLRVVLVVGLLVALVAFLAGPSRAAEAVRRQWRRLGSARDEGTEPGPIPAWVGRNATGLRVALLVVLALLLLTWTRPTGLVVLWLAIAGVVGLALIQVVGAGATRPPVEDAGT
ncbi:MAG: hypothetical protein ACXVJA_05535 [Acidimicrobiia bacterium]